MHEIAVAGVSRLLHDLARRLVELLLQAVYCTRGEGLRDDLAQAGVLGRVMVDQQAGLGDLQRLRRHVVVEPHDDAVLRGRPVLGVLGDVADVGVLGDDPVATVAEAAALAGQLGVPPHGCSLAELGELLLGHAVFHQVGVGEIPPLLRHEGTLRCRVALRDYGVVRLGHV